MWVNTNGYLKGTYDMPENVTVIGGKTGTTEAAGSCLVLYSESQDKKPYISIVLKGNSQKGALYADDGTAHKLFKLKPLKIQI